MKSIRGPAFLILVATLTATAGTGISIVAFPWLALQHDDSARDASIVAALKVLKKGGFGTVEATADGKGLWVVCQGITGKVAEALLVRARAAFRRIYEGEEGSR